MQDKLEVYYVRLPESDVNFLKKQAAEETLKRGGEVVQWSQLLRDHVRKLVGDYKSEQQAEPLAA